jgi:hypothetical protein
LTRTTVAANAILAVLRKDIAANVPMFFQAKVLAAAPGLSGECADAVIKALDAMKPST